MDIKLRARLAAYSRVSSTASSLPIPGTGNAGDVLGVDSTGSFTFIDRVTNEQIDSLFDGELDTARVVTKTEIDTLFDDDEEPKYKTVTKSQIDSLFS